MDAITIITPTRVLPSALAASTNGDGHPSNGTHWDMIFGLRYLDLDENMSITQNTTLLGGGVAGFGTQAIRVFNIYEVQRMMGHRHITTTERYLHYAPNPEAAARLSGLWSDDTTAAAAKVPRAA